MLWQSVVSSWNLWVWTNYGEAVGAWTAKLCCKCRVSLPKMVTGINLGPSSAWHRGLYWVSVLRSFSMNSLGYRDGLESDKLVHKQWENLLILQILSILNTYCSSTLHEGVKSIGSKDEVSFYESWLWCLPAVWPWTIYVTNLCLSFLICVVWSVIVNRLMYVKCLQ